MVDPADEAVIVQLDEVHWETWQDPQLVEKSPIRWKTLLSGDRTASERLTLGLGEIPQGRALLRHRHAEPEVYFILAGAGVIEIRDVKEVVTPGAAIFIPGNAPHRLANSGDSPLRFLYAFSVDSFNMIEYIFANPEE